jgi:ribosomal protein L1
MDQDVFNMQVRKFLKNVGITSQREIEAAVRAAIDNGTLSGDETVQAKVTLTIDSLGLSTEIDGKIDLK